MFIHHSITLIW